MFRKAITFIKYNNILPIMLGALFLGFGGVMAASPEAREAVANSVVSKEEALVSVDNSFIVSIDLSAFEPSIQITEVTEDAENYYVGYSLQTIDLKDGAWGEVNKSGALAVSKVALGGEDLGLYATKQLSEVSSREIEKLKETQTFEKRNGVSQKVVATTYTGLVGRFLDTKEEAFEGYVPVVVPPKDEPSSTLVANQDISAMTASVFSTVSSNNESSDKTPPTITILGNNPAEIVIRTQYSDNGATVDDNVNKNLGYTMTLDGISITEVQLDTQTVGEHTLVYIAIDEAGNQISATRNIVVYDPFTSTTEPESQNMTVTSTQETDMPASTGTTTQEQVTENSQPIPTTEPSVGTSTPETSEE